MKGLKGEGANVVCRAQDHPAAKVSTRAAVPPGEVHRAALCQENALHLLGSGRTGVRRGERVAQLGSARARACLPRRGPVANERARREDVRCVPRSSSFSKFSDGRLRAACEMRDACRQHGWGGWGEEGKG